MPNNPLNAKTAEASTFRALLEAAPDGILVVDQSGKILLANARCASLLGFGPQDLIGQPIEILVPRYIRDQHVGLRDGYFANPHTRPMGMGLELVAERKDGTWLPVEISISPFEFQERHCAIAIVRDVTDVRRMDRDLKRFNEELKRSNEELEKFAYVASHDLQEPLRMVSGYTQLLKRRYADKLDQDAGEYIDFAVDGVKRMQTLINDLLAYSRLSSRGKVFVPVLVRDVIAQAIANLRVAIDESGAVLVQDELPAQVYGDRVQLIQIFQNLIGNAIKFRREGEHPKITIAADERGDFWRFTVGDNGIGIEPEYSDKIFVIFQRLHTREKYAGTGIGLAMVKKIVERHGGTISVESTPDQGSKFIFTLPAKDIPQ